MARSRESKLGALPSLIRGDVRAAPTDSEVTVPTGLQHDSASSDPPGSDISWLETALFAGPGQVFTQNQPGWRPGKPGSQTTVTWAALPLRGTTRRLVPTSGDRAAEAFRNHHDAMTSRRRQLGRIASRGVGTGALRLAPTVQASAELVFADQDRSVIAAAAAALASDITACAITLGPQRYNRKPVVQLMDNRAKTVAFLKVGADPITSSMVATEATTIGQLQTTSAPLEVPSVLWQADWHGRHVACFSAVGRHGTVVPADQKRLAAIAAAVVEAGGGRRTSTVDGSGPVERLRSIAALTENERGNALADRVESVLGHQAVTLGSWHGDFSPWNMISTTKSTALIDWEFASTDMPVGADLLHNRVMVATHLRNEPAREALQQLLDLRSAIPELQAMDIPAHQHRPHLVLYLLELVRRDIELQHAGRTVTGFGEPASQIADVILAEARDQ